MFSEPEIIGLGTIPFPTTSAVVIRRCETVGSITTVATARCIRVWIVREGRIELSVVRGAAGPSCC